MKEKKKVGQKMKTKEKLNQAKEKGITLKMISSASDINVSTIYSYNCGKSNLSKEKEEKLNKILDFFLGVPQC